MSNTLSESCLHTVKAGDLHFRVFIQGEGKPLLLLHGFPDNLELWTAVIPNFVSQGYKVIAIDQRGFGETDAPVGRRHYKIKTIVDDISQVLKALNIEEPVYMLSHDWGAIIGWCFALFYPEKIKTHVAVSVGHPRSYGTAGLNQKLGKGFYTLWFQLKGLAEFYLLHGGFHRLMGSHRYIDEALQHMSRPGRLTAGLNWYRANLLDVMMKPWPRCRVPTLGVWGSSDPFLTEEQMTHSEQYMDALWAYSHFDDAGHWVPLDAPEALSKAALEWFEKH